MAAIVPLYVTALTVGLLFSFFWLGKAALLYKPDLRLLPKRAASKLMKSISRRRRQPVAHDTTPTGPSLPATASSDQVIEVELDHYSGADQHGKHQSNALPKRKRTVVQPFSLEWRDVSCTVHRRVILQPMSGKAFPFEMLAIMGPSGAGKSTLLDILAARKSSGCDGSGKVFVPEADNGGYKIDHFVNYVPQESSFVPTMSARETVTFYAAMLLPSRLPAPQRRLRVEDALAQMGLSQHGNTLVGGMLPGGLPVPGLSGGERKRLGIAAGLVAGQPIIVLDEPTTGLDSFAALVVMQYLKELADNGRTLIATIHQPRAAIWHLLDRVLLLCQGHMVYWGPRGDMAPWVCRYLSTQYDPRVHGVASDWIMDLITGENSDLPARIAQLEQAARVELVQPVLPQEAPVPDGVPKAPSTKAQQDTESGDVVRIGRRTTSVHEGGLELTQGQAGEGSAGPKGKRVSFEDGPQAGPREAARAAAAEKAQAASLPPASRGARLADGARLWFRSYVALVWRELLSVSRNPGDMAGRMLLFVCMGTLTSLLNYGLPVDALSLERRMHAMFLAFAFYLLIPFVFMSFFVADKQLYVTDVGQRRIYTPSAYFLAKISVALPLNALVALPYSTIVYGMLGLRPSVSAALQNISISVLLAVIALQVMHLCAVVAVNQDLGFMLAVAWTAVNLLVSNFFQPYSLMTVRGVAGLRWISAASSAWEGILSSELRHRTFNCSSGMGTQVFGLDPEFMPNSPGSLFNNPLLLSTINSPGSDCIADSDAVLDWYRMYRSFGQVLGYMLGYLAVVCALTYLGLLALAYRSRRR